MSDGRHDCQAPWRAEGGRQGFGDFYICDGCHRPPIAMLVILKPDIYTDIHTLKALSLAMHVVVRSDKRDGYSGQHLPLHERALALHPTSMLTTRQFLFCSSALPSPQRDCLMPVNRTTMHEHESPTFQKSFMPRCYPHARWIPPGTASKTK